MEVSRPAPCARMHLLAQSPTGAARVRRLCIFGLAASGKSTASRMVSQLVTQHGDRVEVVKIAEPLYRLQQHVYATAGRRVDLWAHDNEMLRLLAAQLRRINPLFLVEDFLARVRASTADVIINDDLRDVDVDYPRLVAAGFQFLHVACPDAVRAARLAARGDLTVVPDTVDTWGFGRLTPDWTVENATGDPGQLLSQLCAVVQQWLSGPVVR